MPSRFALYGVATLDAASVADGVSAVLGIELSSRDSSYKGGDYFFHRSVDGMEISIERHEPDEEGFFAESEYPQYKTLVYVNYGQLDVEGKLSAIEWLKPLRVEIV